MAPRMRVIMAGAMGTPITETKRRRADHSGAPPGSGRRRRLFVRVIRSRVGRRGRVIRLIETLDERKDRCLPESLEKLNVPGQPPVRVNVASRKAGCRHVTLAPIPFK